MSSTKDNTTIKIITPTVHSVIDYAAIVVLVIAPSVFGLGGVFAYGAYGLAVAHFILTITTRFDGGMFSVLSLRVHGLLELLIALGLIVSPWIFQFADMVVERNFFLLFGIVLFGVWILTDYTQTGQSAHVKDASETDKQAPEGAADDQAEEGEAESNNEDF
jgi:hypothetical protein